MDAGAWTAKQLIRASQYTYFRGRGGYSGESAIGTASPFTQAAREAERVGEFFRFFPDLPIDFNGRDVLDFGSGYGGRTVEYAANYGAKFVYGVEPFGSVIERSREYARHRDIGNIEFRQCGHFDIPLPDSSIDIVLSYDVLEHVRDPRRSMREIYRVLRPGGSALLVFPVYWGAFSHHLDYICLLPGLHWVFSAESLVRAVNSILTPDGRTFATSPQPEPELSFDGARRILPGLNGLHGGHIGELLQDFETVRMHRHSWLRRRQPQSWVMAALSRSGLPLRMVDALTSSVSVVLRRPYHN